MSVSKTGAGYLNFFAAVTATTPNDLPVTVFSGFVQYNKTTKTLAGEVDTLHTLPLLLGVMRVHYTCWYEKSDTMLTANSNNINSDVLCMLRLINRQQKII